MSKKQTVKPIKKGNTMSFSYTLDNACKTYKLDKELNEISGISVMKKNNLACIHDESRDIYELKNDKIIHHFKSKKAGDIEDIAIINNTAYLLDAKNCIIYEYKNFKKSLKNFKQYKLPLGKGCNPEGLCYDSHNKCLLLACKDNPKKNSPIRSVFKFDLKDKKLSKKSYFTIDAKELSKHSKKTFNPSGIAIHPKTREIYLISSKALKMIIRLNKTGSKILAKKTLNKKMFGQPEGIAFSKNGDLFIATEKKNNATAKICKFKQR